jgi:hypothetical protein
LLLEKVLEPHLVELHLVYIAEESASELHPADLESGAPVVLLQFPSVAEQFQGYLDCSGREVKRHSQYYLAGVF